MLNRIGVLRSGTRSFVRANRPVVCVCVCVLCNYLINFVVIKSEIHYRNYTIINILYARQRSHNKLKSQIECLR
jgi:hypothetical protein